jgi:hypothetical protein
MTIEAWFVSAAGMSGVQKGAVVFDSPVSIFGVEQAQGQGKAGVGQGMRNVPKCLWDAIDLDCRPAH